MDQIFIANVILYTILGWIVFENTLNFYISFRQVKVYKNTKTIPQELEKVINKETFHKARLYGLDRIQCEMFENIMVTIMDMLILYFGLIALIWHMAELSAELLAELWAYEMKSDPNREIVTTYAYITIYGLIYCVLYMPFQVYKVFVLQKKHGFNNDTPLFVYEQLRVIFALLVCFPLIVTGIVFIFQSGGQYFFIWLWLLSLILLLVLLSIYPLYLDKNIPLEQGPLRQSIENLAASVEFPLSQLYIVENSEFSSHRNAYCYGFCKSKQIVLYDTLLLNRGKKDETQLKEEERGKGCTDEQVLAVLAHEIGHWKFRHFIKKIILIEVISLLVLVAFGFLYHYGPFYQAAGFEPGKQPIIVGLHVIFYYVMAPSNRLIKYGETMLSRKFEYQADEFAYKLGLSEQLAQALFKLYSDNLEFPISDWLYSRCNNSHSTPLERFKRLKELEKGKKLT